MKVFAVREIAATEVKIIPPDKGPDEGDGRG